MDDLESLKKQLEELKALRNNLSVDANQEIVEETKVEEESNDIRTSLREELDIIDEQIKGFEEDIKQTAKEYEESYKKLKAVIDEYENSIESTNLLSEEELNELREKYESLKLEENERSNEIKNRLDAQKKIISQLKSKKTKIEKNITNAEALELTYEEYKEITGTLRKTAIMNKILEEKGLTSIIEKKANERTAEEKELLRKTKEEILTEVSEFKKEHDDYSVLDTIEALYSLDTQYVRVESPRVTTCTSKELMVIGDTTQDLSFRVINPNAKVNTTSIEETPKDMENATTNEMVDINELKPAEEKVTIFDEDGKYYVRKYTVDRFKLKSADLENEVRINGSLCYKINAQDVERIKENANNDFSPYKADVREISLEDITVNGISPADTKDELIPGTNIKRPRDRKPLETDEEYEAFLKNYYDKVFPQQEETIKPNTTETSLVVVPQEEEIEEYETVQDNNIEKIVIYKENDRYYVRSNVVDRFKLKSVNKDEPTDIEGSLCYEISKEDFERIQNNKDNDYSPYRIEIEEVEEEKEEELTEEDVNDVVDEEINKEEETTEALTEEDITSIVDEGLEEAEEKENEASEEIEEGKEYNYTIEKKDDKLEASNVKATKKFKLELKKGGILYSIVHGVPKIVKNIAKKLDHAYNNYLFGREMAEKIDKFEREQLGRKHFYDDDEDELEAMMEEKTEETTNDDSKTR